MSAAKASFQHSEASSAPCWDVDIDVDVDFAMLNTEVCSGLGFLLSSTVVVVVEVDVERMVVEIE